MYWTKDQIERAYQNARGLREQIHCQPELGHHEFRTSQLISNFLLLHNIELIPLGSKTGVVGYIRGRYPGKILALREDIDALPIQENTGLPFASQIGGVSHACGHDIHTAALMGCAQLLISQRDCMHGSVLLIFQCAEETFDGAATMLEHGLFCSRYPDAIVGFHCSPDLPLGSVGVLSGIADASCDMITLRILGKSGHGAYPYRAVDPVLIGAGLLMQLQTVITRNNCATDPAVLTFGEFHAGTAPNIIPGEAVLRGNLRTFDNDVRKKLLGKIDQISQGYCAAMGARVETIIERGMPPLINSSDISKQIIKSVRTILGEDAVTISLKPSLGSDDFSCLLEKCGGHGVQYLLGTAVKDDPKTSLGLHVAENVFPSEALLPGILSLSQFAMDYLR